VDWARGSLTISTDPARVDRKLVHEILASSYWAEGIPREVVDRSIENSLVFGLYEGLAQIGFARVSQIARPSRISPTCSSSNRTARKASASG
jgi:hypothetical protein